MLTDEEKKTIKEKKRRKLDIFLIQYFKWIVIFIIIVVVALGYFFILNPKYKEVRNIIKYVEDQKQGEYVGKEEYLKNMKELISFYNKVKSEDIEKISLILPKENETDRLFTEIENIVLKKGIILKSLSISKDTEEETKKTKKSSVIKKSDNDSADKEKDSGYVLNEKIGTINISISMDGVNYVAMKGLIKAIENNLRIMDIKKLGFDPLSEKFSLDIVTYYLKED